MLTRIGMMKALYPEADPDAAARKLVEIVQRPRQKAAQDGRSLVLK